MTPTWQSEDGRIKLYNCSCFDYGKFECDAVISDPPFSSRTHDGHDSGARSGYDAGFRNTLSYTAWGKEHVSALCKLLPPKGWVCILTDHTLARDWEAELLAIKRYVFAPLPCVMKGRSVRLCGDGPSSWTDWLLVSRTTHEHKWGTLPGYYEGKASEIVHTGGKPVGMMCNIVTDYSNEGDTVLDFCAGSMTTGIACIRNNRKFIGIEQDPITFELAKKRIITELSQPRFPIYVSNHRNRPTVASEGWPCLLT